MNYTFRQLEVYHAVGSLLSFTKAAAKLYLTQPAVSIQFKTFSQQFDFPLIEYQSKNMVLTELGEEVFIRVKQILDHAAALSTFNTSLKDKLAGTLTISVVSTGKYIMPYIVKTFIDAHPDVDLVMDVNNRLKVIESLEKNSVDFSLVSVLPKNLPVKTLELIPNELYLMGSPMQKKLWKTHNMSQMTYLLRERGSSTRSHMEKFLSMIRVTPNKKVELTSNETVKQSVIAGLGISVMPVIGITRELNEGTVVIIPHPKLPIKTNWNLIWRQQKELSPVASAFLKHLEDHKESILKEFKT